MTTEEIVQVADKAIRQFTQSWQSEPYCWLYEIDVQMELTQLIRNQLTSDDDRFIHARHSLSPDRSSLHRFQRVACEPYVKITPARRAIHPDIVAWRELPDSDPTFINDGDWPILWIAEIKYSFDDPAAGEDDDKDRLLQMLKAQRVNAACQVVLLLRQGQSRFYTSPENDRLKIYRIYLP